MGAGRKLGNRQAREAAVKALKQHLTIQERAQQSGAWRPGDIHGKPRGMLKYVQAFIPGVGAIDTFLYSRAVSKQSFWLLVQYEVRGRLQLWVARVAYFLKVSQEGKADLRIAVTTLFARSSRNGPLYIIRDSSVHQEDYPVAMTSIVCTMVSCRVRDTRPLSKRGARNTAWMDAADAGKVYLVRAADVSRFY